MARYKSGDQPRTVELRFALAGCVLPCVLLYEPRAGIFSPLQNGTRSGIGYRRLSNRLFVPQVQTYERNWTGDTAVSRRMSVLV